MPKLSSYDWTLVLISLLLAGAIGVIAYFAPSSEWSGVLAFVAALVGIILTTILERFKQKDTVRAELYKTSYSRSFLGNYQR